MKLKMKWPELRQYRYLQSPAALGAAKCDSALHAFARAGKYCIVDNGGGQTREIVA